MSIGAIDHDTPLLRSPPFPSADAAVSRAISRTEGPPIDIDGLFAAIREARVGGDFWLPPAPRSNAQIVVRPRSTDEMDTIVGTSTEGAVRAGDLDPWSLLDDGVRLVAHGDDEWVALAHIAGCDVQIRSEGRFGAPGATRDDIRARVAQTLCSVSYRNPFTGEDASIESAIEQLADWRRILEANAQIAATCGMAWWKRHEIARFLWSPNRKLRFFRSERRAVADAARQHAALAVWPSRITPALAERARMEDVPLFRVEDGFVRSVGLGSNLVPPSSVAVDRLGIHYDPTRPSDLETILADAQFPPALLARAERLRQVILAAGISKYGAGEEHVFPERRQGRRLVLVPGQVEDDMSVRLGGGGLSSNLELLRRARALEPDAEIWFRPHPDVDAGHRKGAIPDSDALRHADRIVRGGGMARLLDLVDGVHVLTSLAGFEALLRGRDVTCHGTPFYAGWTLTRDLGQVSERRGRPLTVAQLIAAVLIVYPRYLDPVTGLPCPPEILIRRMTDGADHNRLGWVTRIRRLQGLLAKALS